jgi:hypothetical protein
MIPITHKQRQWKQQDLSYALAYYSLLRNSGMTIGTGITVGVRGGAVYLSDASAPLLKITPRGVVPLTNDPAMIQAALQLTIQLAIALYGRGATLPIQASFSERRAFRRAGFTVINDNLTARATPPTVTP